MRTSAPPAVRRLAVALAVAATLAPRAWAEDPVPAGWAAGAAATLADEPGFDPQLEAAGADSPSSGAPLRAPVVETFRDPGGSLYQVGQASWYGADFAGLPTASGEAYDMHASTVAHPRWPLGSIVRVENLENGRLALARVNDRGPFARGRILDCSQRIASTLGFTHQGCATVRVTLLDSLPDAWTRFDGFRPPFMVATATPALRHFVTHQSDAMLAIDEDTTPPLLPMVTVAATDAVPARPVLRVASVLPFPAIWSAWQGLSRWLLQPAHESARWTRVERAVDRLGLRGFLRQVVYG